jgi:hypothetical protein
MNLIPKPPLGSANSSARAISHPAKSMNEASPRSKQLTFLDSPNVISSPESEVGAMPCDSPAGPTINPSGPEAVPASPSAPPANRWVAMIRAIYGRRSAASSTGADLQRYLESRLRARLDVDGSLEYCLTWKSWDMPGRQPICALRASARRTSGSDYSGWPSPKAKEGREWSPNAPKDSASGHGLGAIAQTAPQVSGWLTPSANEDAAGRPGAQMQAMLGSQCKVPITERERERGSQTLAGLRRAAETGKTLRA